MWRCARLRETRLPLNSSLVVATLSRRGRRKNRLRRGRRNRGEKRVHRSGRRGDVIKSWRERGHDTRTITIPWNSNGLYLLIDGPKI